MPTGGLSAPAAAAAIELAHQRSAPPPGLIPLALPAPLALAALSAMAA